MYGYCRDMPKICSLIISRILEKALNVYQFSSFFARCQVHKRIKTSLSFQISLDLSHCSNYILCSVTQQKTENLKCQWENNAVPGQSPSQICRVYSSQLLILTARLSPKEVQSMKCQLCLNNIKQFQRNQNSSCRYRNNSISRFTEALSPETSMARIKLKRTELEITRKIWIK